MLAQHAAALADASGGRFSLGLGSSSNVIVERWNEVPFTKPLTRVREAVEALRPILEGGRGPGGFKLETAPSHPVPIVVAALRDKMLRLAGERADGTFVNFLPLSALPHVTEQIREGERAGGREGESEVVCRFFCIPQSPEEGMGVARFLLSAYATVPVYEAFFRAHGWGDALDPMVERVERGRPQARARARARGPDPRDRHLRHAGGDARAARRVRRRRHHDAGADVPERPRAGPGADRRAGSLSLERIWPDRAATTADELVGEAARPPGRTSRRSWSPRSTGARRWQAPRARSAARCDLQLLLALRRRADALMVGPATVRAEGYGPLPCPAVLVSRSFDLPWEAGPVRRRRGSACSSTRAREARAAAGRGRGRGRCRSSSSARCSPTCAAAGSSRLLCEGGPTLNRALLAAGLLDELFLTLSPLVAGDDSQPGDHRRRRAAEPARLALRSVATADGELYLRYSV